MQGKPLPETQNRPRVNSPADRPPSAAPQERGAETHKAAGPTDQFQSQWGTEARPQGPCPASQARLVTEREGTRGGLG